MKDKNCIFCKLANGEIPSHSIYEDNNFNVILDANPASRGHALILPKEHAADVYELTDSCASSVFALAKRLSSSMRDILHFDGLNILQNNGSAAGQTVYHFHMHLIPRYEGSDDKDILRWKPQSISDDELSLIRRELSDM